MLEALNGATLDKFVGMAGIGLLPEVNREESKEEESKDPLLNKSFTPQKGQASVHKENIDHLGAFPSS